MDTLVDVFVEAALTASGAWRQDLGAVDPRSMWRAASAANAPTLRALRTYLTDSPALAGVTAAMPELSSIVDDMLVAFDKCIYLTSMSS